MQGQALAQLHLSPMSRSSRGDDDQMLGAGLAGCLRFTVMRQGKKGFGSAFSRLASAVARR